MKFGTVERCGRVHVVKNGVESAAFVEKVRGCWYLYDFVIAATIPSPAEGIAIIADAMSDWYTTSQAAEALAEMGAFNEPPSTQLVAGWCREGLLPGAVKVRGRGARGSGGSWRIPGAALQTLANERREER